MSSSSFVLVVLSLIALAISQGQETLVFHDDFTSLDTSVWQHEITMSGGGNWEFERYWNNRSTSYTNNSVLYIKPMLLSDVLGIPCVTAGCEVNIWGDLINGGCTDPGFYGCQRSSVAGATTLNPVLSARIRSATSFSFKYGRAEIRAKLPRGDWIWPAIWLLPRHQSYGQWPASGEIDLVESRGNVGYPSQYGGGPESFGSTLHFGPGYGSDAWELAHQVYTLPSGDFSTDFHTFGLFWNETTLYTYVDNDTNKVLVVDFSKKSLWQQAVDAGYNWGSFLNPWSNREMSAPFDQEFYLIMNVAVGGVSGYFPDGVAAKPWSDKSANSAGDFWNARGSWYPSWQGESSALQIDSVSIWSLPNSSVTHNEKLSDDDKIRPIPLMTIVVGMFGACLVGCLIGGLTVFYAVKNLLKQTPKPMPRK
eukprot:c12795_g1_i1.p1 GENE.c12795_g1_i1~~c12795_g1_i1.p1  ORF type:complete len:422 (+),score=171.09 c12795_g1_i1:28-1293(+)